MNGVAPLPATSDGGRRSDANLDLLRGRIARHLRAAAFSPSSMRHPIGTR